jgi:hypothetical protein
MSTQLGRTAMLIGLAVAANAALTLCATAAAAHSTGETGHSSKQGSTCNACHSGGVPPAVRFTGPDTVAAGETATYRFEVQSMGAAQHAAGFNVAASGGGLGIIDGQGEQFVAAVGELTHTMPKENVDMVAGWDFRWTAPAAPGAFTLFGAGNSVDRNGQNSGDRASTTTFVIHVGNETPTPTATAQPATPTTAATPRPSVGVTPTGGSGGCAGDCDGNHTVAVNEAVAAVGVALGTLSIDACRAADLDGDGRVGINELVAAITNELDGCR